MWPSLDSSLAALALERSGPRGGQKIIIGLVSCVSGMGGRRTRACK
jgi:hypothetical protein